MIKTKVHQCIALLLIPCLVAEPAVAAATELIPKQGIVPSYELNKDGDRAQKSGLRNRSISELRALSPEFSSQSLTPALPWFIAGLGITAAIWARHHAPAPVAAGLFLASLLPLTALGSDPPDDPAKVSRRKNQRHSTWIRLLETYWLEGIHGIIKHPAVQAMIERRVNGHPQADRLREFLNDCLSDGFAITMHRTYPFKKKAERLQIRISNKLIDSKQEFDRALEENRAPRRPSVKQPMHPWGLSDSEEGFDLTASPASSVLNQSPDTHVSLPGLATLPLANRRTWGNLMDWLRKNSENPDHETLVVAIQSALRNLPSFRRHIFQALQQECSWETSDFMKTFHISRERVRQLGLSSRRPDRNITNEPAPHTTGPGTHAEGDWRAVLLDMLGAQKAYDFVAELFEHHEKWLKIRLRKTFHYLDDFIWTPEARAKAIETMLHHWPAWLGHQPVPDTPEHTDLGFALSRAVRYHLRKTSEDLSRVRSPSLDTMLQKIRDWGLKKGLRCDGRDKGTYTTKDGTKILPMMFTFDDGEQVRLEFEMVRHPQAFQKKGKVWAVNLWVDEDLTPGRSMKKFAVLAQSKIFAGSQYLSTLPHETVEALYRARGYSIEESHAAASDPKWRRTGVSISTLRTLPRKHIPSPIAGPSADHEESEPDSALSSHAAEVKQIVKQCEKELEKWSPQIDWESLRSHASDPQLWPLWEKMLGDNNPEFTTEALTHFLEMYPLNSGTLPERLDFLSKRITRWHRLSPAQKMITTIGSIWRDILKEAFSRPSWMSLQSWVVIISGTVSLYCFIQLLSEPIMHRLGMMVFFGVFIWLMMTVGDRMIRPLPAEIADGLLGIDSRTRTPWERWRAFSQPYSPAVRAALELTSPKTDARKAARVLLRLREYSSQFENFVVPLLIVTLQKYSQKPVYEAVHRLLEDMHREAPLELAEELARVKEAMDKQSDASRLVRPMQDYRAEIALRPHHGAGKQDTDLLPRVAKPPSEEPPVASEVSPEEAGLNPSQPQDGGLAPSSAAPEDLLENKDLKSWTFLPWVGGPLAMGLHQGAGAVSTPLAWSPGMGWVATFVGLTLVSVVAERVRPGATRRTLRWVRQAA